MSIEVGGDASDEADEPGYEYWVSGGEAGHEGRAEVLSVGTDGPLGYVPYVELATDADGATCISERWEPYFTDAERATMTADADRIAADLSAFVTPFPPACPGPDPEPDPGVVARRAAQQIAGTIAPAVPYVQPDNRALTGIRSYLDTGVPSTETRHETVTLFGRDWGVAIDIAGTHTIDWGDGSPVEVTTATGGPWHEGEPGPDDISHHYLQRGSFALVVSTEWTVTATLDATGTTATQTVTTSSSPVAIEVTEAVARRDT